MWLSKRYRRPFLYVAALAVMMLIIILLAPLPSPLFDDPYATTLRAANGQLLGARLAGDEQWRFPSSDSLPDKFITALRLFEDEYYYYHPGINPVSLLRAVRQNWQAGKTVSGGSTISMQTVRIAMGNQPRTYWQKVKEMLATLKLELLYSKSTILQQYADHAPYGGNIVGINAASWRFFGRMPHQLSWAETALLAVLPNSPAHMFPGRNNALLTAKRNTLLEKLHARGYLDDDALVLARAERVPGTVRALPDEAYHLLSRSIQEGHEGQNVHSTIDWQLQHQASRVLNEYSKNLAFNEIHNAAALIVDLRDNTVLAYVGNKTLKEADHGWHVDVIGARRSPGSLLKPLLYAMALDQAQIAPQQLLPDIPVIYNGFAPKNFDKQYRGAVAADQALISSLNVPFVHLLIDYGYDKFHQNLVNLGFSSFDRHAGHYGLSIILGGAETTMWQMADVYATVANRYQQTHLNRTGYTRGLHYTATEPVAAGEVDIYPGSIRMMLAAMQNLQRPYTEDGWQQFGSSQRIAWKTGTSYGFRDGWALGISDDHLIVVWAGNADGEGRPGLTGVHAAAPLLFQLFDLVESDLQLTEPYGVTRNLCVQSGMLAGDECPDQKAAIIPEYMVDSKVCNYHKIIHLNKDKTYQINSDCYNLSLAEHVPWFVLPPVQAWYYQKFHPYNPPPPYLESCTPQHDFKQIDIIYPNQFTKVKIPREQSGEQGNAIFKAAHSNNDMTLFWHVDNEYLGQTHREHEMAISLPEGLHMLTLVDELGNEASQRFEVIN